MNSIVGFVIVVILFIEVMQNRRFQRRISELLHAQRGARSVIDDTHEQVVTMNESSMGQLAADAETRRVREKPHDDRTAKEQRHVDDAPPDAPPQGPRR